MLLMRRALIASICLASLTIDCKTNAGEIVFGVTDNQFLVSWDSSAPGSLLSGLPISGQQSNEQILAIDFRPATGQLYALGSTSRLYTLNTASGALSSVGSGPFSPPINGSSFGFDFNPTIDRIRLDSDVDKNYVLNPNDGTATEVTDLFFGPGDVFEGENPNVVHAAYTNNFAGATSTQLYGIDTGKDVLVTQANSAGTLGTVGSIGVDVTSVGGFDISGLTGTAYLAVRDTDIARSTFWSIDLGTGIGSSIGEIGGGNIVTAIAITAIPEPATGLLFGIATCCCFAIQRKR